MKAVQDCSSLRANKQQPAVLPRRRLPPTVAPHPAVPTVRAPTMVRHATFGADEPCAVADGNDHKPCNAINAKELIRASKAATVAGLKPKKVYRNLSVPELYEMALKLEPDTVLTDSGALVAMSGEKTGRSPRDKRVMVDPITERDVWWGKGSPNYPMDERTFLLNRARAVDFLNFVDQIFILDGYANWDPETRTKIRVVCSRPYHALFMHNMLIRPTAEELESFGEPDFVIYNAGSFPANQYTNYMTSKSSIDVSLAHKEMVILGTQYAGEMKKGVFTIMHYLMPKRNVLTLHSGCNMGKADDVTLFFGLSGTGKTTLSADPQRPLIGDDEHCWSDDGVFNIEGGCYAKCINLTEDREPEIYHAIKFGTVLENVVLDPRTRKVDFDATSITENTRASYPIEFITNAHIPCRGGHPKNIIFLACDAFGVLPPVSKLTLEQAMYHFVSGYTAKVAGTEMGIKEPEATFSACFGSAFLMWHPMKYASMLSERVQKYGTNVWLINTGWQGGSFGVGQRISLKNTRAIINAIHSGELDKVQYTETPIFKLSVPTSCPGVPDTLLNPELQWSNKAEFRSKLEKLSRLFTDNFELFGDGDAYVGPDMVRRIVSGGPDMTQVPPRPEGEKKVQNFAAQG